MALYHRQGILSLNFSFNLLTEMPSLRPEFRNPLVLDVSLVDYCCSLEILRVILVILLDYEIDVSGDVFAQFIGDADGNQRVSCKNTEFPSRRQPGKAQINAKLANPPSSPQRAFPFLSSRS